MKARETTTIAAPRADWMLLRMHYLRVVAPLAAVCFGTLAMFWLGATIVQRLRGDSSEIGEVLDFIAVLLSVLVALPSGAAVFSRPFKDQHLIFFHSLPMRRLRQWLVLSGASLLALLTVYAGFAILRPRAIDMLRGSGTTWVFVFGVAIAFAAGLCFALVFTRTVVVYIAAHVAAVIVPLAIALALLAPGLAFERSPIPLEGDRAIDMLFGMSNRVPIVFVLTLTVVLIVVLVATSAAFYVRGEVTLPRVQAANAAIVAAAIVAIVLGATTAVHGLAGGEKIWSEWRPSPDGRRAVATGRHHHAPWRSHVRVVDLVSGAPARTWEMKGLVYVAWMSPDELVTVVRDVSPLHRLGYLRDPNDRVMRWSATGVKLADGPQNGAVEGYARTRRQTLRFAARVGDDVSIRELQRDGRFVELMRAPALDYAYVGSDLVIFESVAKGKRVWRLGSEGPREIRRIPVATRQDQVWIFGDTFYPTSEALLEMLERDLPAPRGPDDRVEYAILSDIRYLYALVANPAAAKGTLLVLDAESRRWNIVTADIELGPKAMPRERVRRFESTPSVEILQAQNRALLALRENGATLFRLHDAKSGTVTTLLTRPANDPRQIRWDTQHIFLPRQGVIIRFKAGDTTIAEFLSTEAGISEIRHRPAGDAIAVLPDGSQIRQTRSSIVRYDANGAPTGKAKLNE